MIDPALVTRKIVLISSDLKEVIELAKKGKKEYLADRHAEVLAERYLERLIGRMIDINFHLITESGHPPPKDYHQSFTKLGELGILPQTFSSEIAFCAGLRNRIAHDYDELDPAKIFDGLEAAAKQIPPYLRHIQTFLDSLG